MHYSIYYKQKSAFNEVELLDGLSPSLRTEVTRFVLKDLRRETIGDMTEDEAQAEGYPSLEMYKALILRMHQGMEWNESAKVWVHEFERSPD